jgi:hypothetical protein
MQLSEEEGWDPTNRFNPRHICCACPNLEPGFTTLFVVVFFVFRQLRWNVMVRFFYIGGIVDHHFKKHKSY